MSKPSIPGTQPARPEPLSPMNPEKPLDEPTYRERRDAPEQYPDDKDMPLPND